MSSIFLYDFQYNKWTKSSEGWVLAAISIGYYVIQLPVAVISVHLGSCRVVLVATCICVMTSFLSVPALYWGPLASGVVCFVKGASAVSQSASHYVRARVRACVCVRACARVRVADVCVLCVYTQKQT